MSANQPWGPSGEPTPYQPYGSYEMPYGAPQQTLPRYEPGPPPGARRPQGPWLRRLGAGAVLVAVAIGSGVTGAVIADDNSSSSPVVTAAPVDVKGQAAPTETLAKVAAAVQPSVVSITVDAGNSGDTGSGVILRSDGTIVTNNHVVEAAAGGAGSITVKFSDGSTAAATILGRDPATDLAVIKAKNVSGQRPATLGSTSGLHVGDTVLALGSPLGLDGSVSSGIVSALHRTVALGSGSGVSTASVGDAIQTDAAINPGNSGGPLVDIHGQVIGINSAIATLGSSAGSQSGSIGVGFAIPVEEVKSVSDQLIKGQVPKHALLGVNIADNPSGGPGAVITDVMSGGAAAKAGLRAGDVITKVDSTAIDDSETLAAVIRAQQPDQKVTVQFTRGGATQTVTATLGSATG